MNQPGDKQVGLWAAFDAWLDATKPAWRAKNHGNVHYYALRDAWAAGVASASSSCASTVPAGLTPMALLNAAVCVEGIVDVPQEKRQKIAADLCRMADEMKRASVPESGPILEAALTSTFGTTADNNVPAPAAPIQAHSKTEFKRLKAQGVDVLPPAAPTPRTEAELRFHDTARSDAHSVASGMTMFARQLERELADAKLERDERATEDADRIADLKREAASRSAITAPMTEEAMDRWLGRFCDQAVDGSVRVEQAKSLLRELLGSSLSATEASKDG